MSTRRTLLLALSGAVLLLVVAAVAWYEIEAHPFGAHGAREVVAVSAGEPTDAVVSTLARRGVVDSDLAFRLSLLVHGSPVVQPGRYRFYVDQPFSTVRSILAGGPDVFSVDVLPGYTLDEVEQAVEQLPGAIALQFSEAAHHGAVSSPFAATGSDDLEGLLGAGSYQVLPGETGRQLLADMVARFDREAATAGLTTSSAAALGMTPYQLVTVASIAQKEGYLDQYMGKVARVIYNRLVAGMALDMTSTVLYSLGQDGGPVTAADRSLDTPYNTYLHTGLTPTPICVPSETALKAAVAPPPGDWLYFTTVDKSGTTLFTGTYQQQLANEQLAQRQGMG